jgi:uncharacterized protein YpmB
MDKSLIIVIAIAISLFSCESKQKKAEEITDKIDDSVREIKIRDNPEKLYRKNGTVKRVVEGMTVVDKSVNIWLEPNTKISVYNLSPGEDVIIYNETTEGYIFIAPKSDTLRTGYLLKGWISFID